MFFSAFDGFGRVLAVAGLAGDLAWFMVDLALGAREGLLKGGREGWKITFQLLHMPDSLSDGFSEEVSKGTWKRCVPVPHVDQGGDWFNVG